VFTYYIPVLIPILGVETGVIYVSARAGDRAGDHRHGRPRGRRSAVRAQRGPLRARRGRRDRSRRRRAHEPGSVRGGRDEVVVDVRRTVLRLAVVHTLVIAFVTHYDVEALTSVAEPITGLLGLPGAAVPVIAVYTLDTTAGAVTLAGTAEGSSPFGPRSRACSSAVSSRSPSPRSVARSLPVRDLGRRIRHEGDRRQHRPEAPVHLDHSRAVARAGVVRLRGFINTTCGGVCLRAAALDGREQPARGRRRVAPAARESPILAGVGGPERSGGSPTRLGRCEVRLRCCAG